VGPSPSSSAWQFSAFGVFYCKVPAQHEVSCRQPVIAVAILLCISMLSQVAEAGDPYRRESTIAAKALSAGSPQPVIDAMLELAGVRATDFLVDLGSGDGRIVINAAKNLGARGFGVEIDPRMVAIANDSARRHKVDDRIKFVHQDLFDAALGSATVVTMYLNDEYNMALRPRLFALKAGTRIVSHQWHFGNWEADAKMKIAVPDKPADREQASWIYLWVVPAKISGDWSSRVPQASGWVDIRFRFNQQFQKISGDATINGETVPMERANLTADFLSFRIHYTGQTLLFTGQVRNGRIVGQVSVSGDRPLRWRALRVGN